ncbi:MAG: YfhO family protein [Myxococcales bacterium]|nr:YfhO family protein [Myxococcales bacterium]
MRWWSRLIAAVALLVFFGALAVLIEPSLGKRGLGGDVRSEHWGSLSLLSNALREGSLPLWSPYERGGYPLLADPQTSVLYPPAWLMATLLPLWNDRPTVMVYYYAAHTAWAALGLLLLLRFFGVRRSAALLGALVLILATRWIKARGASWVFPVSWWPWMILALASLARRPRPLGGVLLGLAVAMAALSGYTPNAAHGTLLLALLTPVLVLMARRRKRCPRRDYYRRLAGALALGLLVGVPLLLPNVLAARELFPMTMRARLEERALYRGALLPDDLLEEPFLPPRDKATAGYIGLAPLALMLGAVVVRPTALRLLLLACVAFFSLLSLGDDHWLLPWLVKNVVGFDLWRIPGNYLFGALMSGAILVGLAADDLRGERRARARVVYCVAALLLLLPLWIVPYDDTRVGAAAALLLGSAALIWAAGSSSRVTARAAMVCLLLLVAFDLRWQAAATFRDLKTAFDREPSDVLAHYAGPEHRVLDNAYAGARFGARTGYRELRGDNSTLELYRVRRFMFVGRHSANVMGAANVRFVAGRGIYGFYGATHKELSIIELRHFAPRAYLTREVLLVDKRSQALHQISRHQPGTYVVFERGDLDGAQRARIERLQIAARREHGSLRRHAGEARVVVSQRERLEIDVSADRPALLVVAEQHYPGWRAGIDGREVTILRANYRFRAVLVPRGKHRVVMIYAPPRVRAALWGYWVALLGALAWIAGCGALAWRRRRRAVAAAATSCPPAPS